MTVGGDGRCVQNSVAVKLDGYRPWIAALLARWHVAEPLLLPSAAASRVSGASSTPPPQEPQSAGVAADAGGYSIDAAAVSAVDD
jgi:hypothetical protein